MHHKGPLHESRNQLSQRRSASNPPLPRRLGGLLLAPGILAGVATPAAHAAGVVFHPAAEVMEAWTVRESGRLCFRGLDGVDWELVTTVEDPAIRNTGSGSFHPLEERDVARALSEMTFPLEGVELEIFLLPYPRRNLLDSNAVGHTLYLSPGVWPLSPEQVSMLVAHEVGHVVHHALLPDYDGSGWAAFREVRGIEDIRTYHEGAVHRNRPQEIFAEDFRVLFGGPLATGSGRGENPDLAPPAQVPGLREFFLGLLDRGAAGPAPRDLVCSPNPTPAGARITLMEAAATGVGAPVDVAVFDIQGRRVTRLRLDATGQALWDGRLADGTQAGPGVYFLRAAGTGAQRWTGKLLIAR